MAPYKNLMRSKYTKNLLQGTALALVFGLTFMNSTPAQAGCVGLDTPTISCTGNSSGIMERWNYSTGVAITASGWTLDAGRLNIHSSYSATPLSMTFTGDNVTVTNGDGNTFINGDGVIHLSNASAGGSASISIVGGNIQVVAPNSQGVAAQAENTTGNATITVSDLVVNLTNTDSRAVLNAAASGTGSASVTMTGGSLTTAGENLLGDRPRYGAVRVASNSGNVNATINGGTITTLGVAYGIVATAGPSGTVNVDSSATIDTRGAFADGIHTVGRDGNTTIKNSGAINIAGRVANGIYAVSSNLGNGNISVTNTGAITLTNTAPDMWDAAYGILTTVEGSGSTFINNSAAITAAYGTAISASGTAGTMTIINSGKLNVHDFGIIAWNNMTATNLDNANVRVENTGTIVSSDGILTRAYGVGTTTVINTADITTTGTGIASDGSNGLIQITNSGKLNSGFAGIDASADGNGRVDVNNTGSITSAGNGMRITSGAGDIQVTNSAAATILTTGMGYGGAGIAIQNNSTGTTTVNNAASITVVGDYAHAIVAWGRGGPVTVNNTGVLSATNIGIYALSRVDGQVNVNNTGAITSVANGIEAGTESGAVEVNNAANVTSSTADGIRLDSVHGTATLNVTGGIVSALNGNGLTMVSMTGNSTMTISSGAEIHGGAAGVLSYSATQMLSNAGQIDALSDVAVMRGVNTAFKILNTGSITGVMTVAPSADGVVTGALSLDNVGVWNLRSFGDTDGDHVRDTWRVAVSDFESLSGNTINNTGVLNMVAQAGTAATFDATGAYLPGGLAANTPVAGGAVQAQILGVQTFSNSGLMDLTGGGSVPGNVLVISGGHTAGTDGGGVYVANGGAIRLNTVLNDGGANSVSDVLVVDSTRLGTAATKLQVNAVGGAGALTTSNGILLIEVLDKAASATGVFAQEGRIVGGAFEYHLYQGGVGDSATDGNWYLRSTLATPPLPPGCEETNTCPKPPPVVPQFRPEVGAYLGNQMAAVAMFRHTLHDRLGEVDYLERQRDIDEGRHAASWVRVTGNLTDSVAAGRQLDLRTMAGMAQAGFELGRWTDGDSRLLLGVMAGAGTAHTTSRSLDGSYDAKGDVTGYSVGLYGTWYQSAADARGLYIDTWVQHGWYDNTVKGDELASESYDSRALSASIEAGYAFELARGERRAYFFEPQAQVIYTDYSANAHREANGTVVTPGDAGGFLTRLGARIYNRPLTMQGERVQPFLEFNWWHAMEDNSVAFNGYSVAQNMPRDTYEVKLGAEAELNDRWTMWGHAGLRLGADDFRDVDLLLGAKYSW